MGDGIATKIVVVTLATVFLQARDLDMARAGMSEQYDQVVADHERYLEQCRQDRKQHDGRTDARPT